jgi:hypothetical protein
MAVRTSLAEFSTSHSSVVCQITQSGVLNRPGYLFLLSSFHQKEALRTLGGRRYDQQHLTGRVCHLSTRRLPSY